MKRMTTGNFDDGFFILHGPSFTCSAQGSSSLGKSHNLSPTRILSLILTPLPLSPLPSPLAGPIKF